MVMARVRVCLSDVFLRDLLVSPYTMVKKNVLPSDAVLFSMACRPEIGCIDLVFTTELLDEDELRREQEERRKNSPLCDLIPPRSQSEPPDYTVCYRLLES